MGKYLLSALLVIVFQVAGATGKDSTIHYNLPDSIKAVQFMTEITVQAIRSKKELFAGIRTDAVSISLESDKKRREIVFEFPKTATVQATGFQTDANEKGEIGFMYDWSLNETYRLLISVATDSAENFSLYSGYCWLPKENKWKLIGTCKITGQWTTIRQPAGFFSPAQKGMEATFNKVWIQRSTGSWKNLSQGTPLEKDEPLPAPVVNLSGHVDSVARREAEIKMIKESIAAGKTDAMQNEQSVYYKLIKEGTGRPVSINDTVVVHYKGYLFADDKVFDQTKDNPATFPLKRLIRGWQIGVPLCKVGGKIKLVIPSDLAYSIRTRAAKIPPNSILVFEIELVDTKPPL